MCGGGTVIVPAVAVPTHARLTLDCLAADLRHLADTLERTPAGQERTALLLACQSLLRDVAMALGAAL